MNNHVHNSRYLDYLLTARYDQMKNNYKVPMEEFIERGYGWVASATNIQFKREIKLGDKVLVRTQLDSFNGAQVTINFWIFIKREIEKVAAEGQGVFTLISTKNGRPLRIPEDIIEKYTI
jgi:acyl-CoA thioester hydrolase/thioesterase-3